MLTQLRKRTKVILRFSLFARDVIFIFGIKQGYITIYEKQLFQITYINQILTQPDNCWLIGYAEATIENKYLKNNNLKISALFRIEGVIY
ncbi:hypothetical protein BUL40_10940 [Croceivirga radicis]|uniref:Uncharacterized protein n=1 Tax=Croceivirga radicis TaxID=1929488 RepID=A0A1V6LQ60_9FLAO|nr:hypothetical protein BUL40_10940 [Croceivirga radicis]